MAGRLFSYIPCALLAATAVTAGAGAAELGEARVASFIGQPLAADIELTMLDNPAGQVEARLASANVYRGGNLGMPHVLSTLSMSVMRRDGRQFLHVTSLAPVESSRLHLYLELLDSGQRNVRLVTLSLAPDPNPKPAPPPVPVPAPLPVAAPVKVVQEAPAPVKAAEAPVRPKPRPVPPRPVVASKPKPAPERAPEPAPEPKPKPTHSIVPPLPIAAAAKAAPAACAPASSPGSPSVCAALDVKNAQLRQQIGALEDKVRVLQVAMGANPAEVSAPRPAAVPKPHPIRKKPAPVPEAQDETPWGWIGAGVAALLALIGGVLWWLRRRKSVTLRPVGEPRVPVMDRLRQRFAGKFTRKKPAVAVEPHLEEGAHDLSTQDQ